MYARVVRFTDVDPDHLAGRLAEAEARKGPPVDISAKGVQILHDADQGTAVVIQLFETADDMAAAEGPLDSMDPGDTPGTRASIDRCEIKAELTPGLIRKVGIMCRRRSAAQPKGRDTSVIPKAILVGDGFRASRDTERYTGFGSCVRRYVDRGR